MDSLRVEFALLLVGRAADPLEADLVEIQVELGCRRFDVGRTVGRGVQRPKALVLALRIQHSFHWFDQR